MIVPLHSVLQTSPRTQIKPPNHVLGAALWSTACPASKKRTGNKGTVKNPELCVAVTLVSLLVHVYFLAATTACVILHFSPELALVDVDQNLVQYTDF